MDCQPRTKNGQPPHRTTGLVSRSRTIGGTGQRMDARIGAVRTAEVQKRRDMSFSSWSGASSSVATTGSSAIPHLGQVPGPI